MRRVGVGHHQFGERVVLQLGEEVGSREAGQVVEPVAVLQGLELGLEHEVEGRAEQAAERHRLLGEAADPEVDVVETGGGDAVGPCPGAGAVQEVEPVGVRRRYRPLAGRRRGRSRLPPSTMAMAAARLAASVVALVIGRMRAVGGDEIDQRFRVLQVLQEVDPAAVGRELAVAGHLEEFARAPRSRTESRCRGRAPC